MKKIMFSLALISGILVFVVSCSEDEEATTTSSDGCTVVTSCSYTASGSISGAAGDNVTLTGTYDKYIQASSTYTIDNTTGCIFCLLFPPPAALFIKASKVSVLTIDSLLCALTSPL